MTDNDGTANFGVEPVREAETEDDMISSINEVDDSRSVASTGLPDQLEQDLDNSWEVLAEPIQTVMRRYGIAEPYEKLKALTRGQTMNQALIQQFIDTLEIPDDAKTRLLAMVPGSYIGNADHQANKV